MADLQQGAPHDFIFALGHRAQFVTGVTLDRTPFLNRVRAGWLAWSDDLVSSHFQAGLVKAGDQTLYRIISGNTIADAIVSGFFGLALFGLEVPAWLAAVIALTCWSSAYLAEIWRGCVESIPRGQWEASSCLAMGYLQQMRHVILPQAFRMGIPPTVGFSVQIVKGTAVTSIIGFVELSKAGTMITNATFQPFTVYALVALMYFALCWPLSKYSQSLERKFNAAHRN